MTGPARETIAEFSRLYYNSRAFSKLQWHGVQTLKYATDLAVYADLIWRGRPQVIVELGTFAGGAALFFAEQQDAVGRGIVVTVDNQDWSGPDGYPDHPRVRYLRGSSTDAAVIAEVRRACKGAAAMVVLDSCHDADHVTAELDVYGPLVTPGCYLVVEDTNVHDVRDDYGDGPDDALADWLPDHPEFVVDRECERFLLTAAPGGWLRRV